MPAELPKEDGHEDDDRRRQHPFERDFGIPIPPYEEDEFAPPIDQVAIRALWQDTLSAEQRRAIWMNIMRFRSWAEALGQIMLERYRELPRDAQD